MTPIIAFIVLVIILTYWLITKSTKDDGSTISVETPSVKIILAESPFTYKRYKSPATALIKIVDTTALQYLEKTDYDGNKLPEDEFYEQNDLDFEIDIIGSLNKAPKNKLKPYEFLYHHFEDLISIFDDFYGEEDGEEKLYPFEVEDDFEKELLKRGYLKEFENKNEQERNQILKDHLEKLKVVELHPLCEKHNVEIIKPKAALIEKMINAGITDVLLKEFSPYVVIDESLIDLLGEVVQMSVNDVKKSIKDLHPKLKNEITEALIDAIDGTDLSSYANVNINVKEVIK